MSAGKFFSSFAFAAGLLFMASGPPAAEAEERLLGVVELYTSQGCNSCPPADAALERLAARDNILALGFHVDYWDYLGWKDTLGSAHNSQRQYDYARSLKRRGVYTPQAIVNGRAHTNGSHFDQIVEMLQSDDAAGRGLQIDLSLVDMSDRMRVTASGGEGIEGKVHLVVVYFQRHADVRVERGENAGKTITYVNAVVDWQTLGMWEGNPLTVDIPTTELAAKNADGCAVLLQSATSSGHPGPIIGAAILPRQDS